MGASRTLLRKLNLDLIARIEASGKPEAPQKKQRTKSRYIPLNRAYRWPLAKSYAYAREIGPSAEMVR